MPVKFKCPGCSAEHDVPDVMSQADHVARLKAKDDAMAVLRTSLSDAQTKAGSYDAVVAERDRFRAELATVKEATARAEAFTAAGIPADPKIRGAFELLFASEVAGAEEGKAPAFGDWLSADDTKAHPLLASAYGKPAAQAGQGQPPAVQPTNAAPPAQGVQRAVVAGPVAGTETGSAPAADRREIKSPEELRAYLASPGFRALPLPKQRERMAELEGQLVHQPGESGARAG